MNPVSLIPLGPFDKGVIAAANPSIKLQGAFKYARNINVSGLHRYIARKGTVVRGAFPDPAGIAVSSILLIQPFADTTLVVAHQNTGAHTGKVLLFTYNAETFTAVRVAGELWTGMTDPPTVTMGEGNGIAYFANDQAMTSTVLSHPTKRWAGDVLVAPTTLQAKLDTADDTTLRDVYFLGVVSYKAHLFGWGFGTGPLVADAYRPEMIRYSKPNFDESSSTLFKKSDSITIGNRVRGKREQVIGAKVAGGGLYVGGPRILSLITGSGRSSWHRQIIDDKYGFVGPKCATSDGDTMYYMSFRGPMRAEGEQIIPMWDAVSDLAVSQMADPHTVVAAHHADADQIIWVYKPVGGTGVNTMLAWDYAREVFLGPDSLLGSNVLCAGEAEKVYTNVFTVPPGPAGAPVAVSETAVSSSGATLNITSGDTAAETIFEYKLTTDSVYTVLAPVAPGVLAQVLTGLNASTSYDWRAKHKKNNQESAYSNVRTFSTAASAVNPPTNPALLLRNPTSPTNLRATWTNSGESGVTTEVWVAGPSATEPVAGDYWLESTVATGVASLNFSVYVTGVYWMKLRHKSENGLNFSAYTAVVSRNVTWVPE